MESDIISKYANVWGDDPHTLLSSYDYQPHLTKKLDALKPEDLNAETFYEIVLWKLNRFPQVSAGLIDELRTVRKIQPKQHREVQPALRKLLTCQGIALPMASTILRFLNPSAFQIIDDRVYRVVYPGKEKYPAKPSKLNERYLSTSEKIYFEYLDELHNFSCAKLPFLNADRIVYQLDIKLGNKIGDEN